MIKYSLYITERQDQRLREIADKNSSSVSEHIRTAINNYLKELEANEVSKSPSKKDQNA